MYRLSAWMLFIVLLAPTGPWAQAETDATPKAEPTAFDQVRLKDGSVILGEIQGLEGGTLSIKTAFGVDEIVKVKWAEIESVQTGASHNFVLSDGSSLKGRITATDGGMATVAGDTVGETTIKLSDVTGVNPPPKKDVELVGNINFGGSVADGNTQTKTASLSANAVAQSERQRLTLGAAWNYSENSISGLTARNTSASIKYDFFISERVFLYGGAFFEEDTFQDLNLRTALSAGPGYQFVKKGDMEPGTWYEQLEVYSEVGLAFFNEDFKTGADNRYLAARWAVRADLPISDRLGLFHYHQGYPGLEDLSDLYITTEQGVRFTIWDGFISTVQVNWRWDNTPSPGFERSDTLYLFTLGYQFKL